MKWSTEMASSASMKYLLELKSQSKKYSITSRSTRCCSGKFNVNICKQLLLASRTWKKTQLVGSSHTWNPFFISVLILALGRILSPGSGCSRSRRIWNSDIEKFIRSEGFFVLTRLDQKEFDETYEFYRLFILAKHL